MDDGKVLSSFSKNLGEFFAVAEQQRSEIYNSFLYLAAYQKRDEDEQRQNRTHANVSLIPAILRAISGSELMRERHTDIVAIEDNPAYNAEADIMADLVDYSTYVSGSKQTVPVAVLDTAACGLGATVKYLDMTQRDVASGVPTSRRIYPGFCFFDTSARGNDLNRLGKFCGYGDPMRTDDLEEYIRQKLKDRKDKKDGYVPYAATGGYFTEQFLNGLRRENMQRVDMLYHYFWKDLEPIRDVQNPMAQDEENPSALRQAVLADEMALEIMAAWAEEAEVDIDAPYWTLENDQYKELEQTISAIVNLTGVDVALQSNSRLVWCYYRAEIAMNQVLSSAKSYSQREFPMNFITGYYDEVIGIYYGFTRPLSYIQDALNIVLDDLLEYSYEAITGGKAYISGFEDDVEMLKKAKASRDKVIPVPRDSQVTPVALASTPQVLMETARMLLELLPRSIGLGQEFFGVITSGTMTDSLYGKVVRQSFAVLADFANSRTGYAVREARLDEDLMRSIARAENNRIFPILSPGKQEKEYVRLTRQSIARQYVIRAYERPVTEDEQQESLKILMQLADPAIMQSPLLPTILQKTQLDQQEKDKAIEAVTPKPQQPDPMQVESVKANIRLLNAQAAELESKAGVQAYGMPLEQAKTQSEVEKNRAQTAKTYSDIDMGMAQILKMMNEMGGRNERATANR